MHQRPEWPTAPGADSSADGVPAADRNTWTAVLSERLVAAGLRPSPRTTRLLLGTLDMAVVVTVGATVAYVLVGPFDGWLLSVGGFAKPFLQALVLSSLRVGIRRASWLSRLIAAVRSSATAVAETLTARVSWAPAVFDAGIAVLVTRLASKVVGFTANLLFPPFQPRGFTLPFESSVFVETFAAWDSGWYFDIAQRGYYFRADGQSSIAFFPLYPLLMRALAWPFGGSDAALWVSGIVLSYLCFFGGLVLLHRLTERMVGSREAARRTVLYMAVFPFSFAFTRVYAESLFLFVSVAAVASAGLGRWTAAGCLGALATLARPNGILIGIPLGLMALQGVGSWRVLLKRALPLALVPGALMAYCLFVYQLSGDPLAWLHAQAQWGYSIGNRPWAAVQHLLDSMDKQGLYRFFVNEERSVAQVFHMATGLAVVALTPSVFRRLGPALGCYVAMGILIPLSGNSIEGIGRYTATLFPVFMYLGATSSKRLHEALLVIGALWLALVIALFVTQHPIY